MKETITLVGNCQTKALAWYIQQLDSSFDVKWVRISSQIDSIWAEDEEFGGKIVPTLTRTEDAIKRVKDSTFLIYQHLSRKASTYFHKDLIRTYNPECNFITVSIFYLLPDRPDMRGMTGMVHRAELHDIDIPGHIIFEKHKDKINIEHTADGKPVPNHPTVVYFLEVVREICKKTGWNYYSDEQYDQYLEEGYPFG